MLVVPKLDDVLRKIQTIAYDDWVDRLNYYVTSLILLVMTIAVASKQVWGSPIQCWLPAEFKVSWDAYVHDYCFIKNTYRVPQRDERGQQLILPTDVAQKHELVINYYQWVPVILALMAFGFLLPNIIWKLLSSHSGLRLKQLVAKAKHIDTIECSPSDVTHLAKYFENALGTHVWQLDHKSEFGLSSKGGGGGELFAPGRKWGVFATVSYIFVKLLYLANAFFQFHMISHMIGAGTSWWGMHAFSEMWTSSRWDANENTHFPRVTLCDFEQFAIGQNIPHTVHCVLMLNMYNEKIFIFLWFWTLAVTIITAINTLYWLITSLPVFRPIIIHRHLRLAQMLLPLDDDKKEDSAENAKPAADDSSSGSSTVRRRKGGQPVEQNIVNQHYADVFLTQRSVRIFTNELLRADGVLAMRFVRSHAGKMAVSRLLIEMFKRHREAITRTRTEHNTQFVYENNVEGQNVGQMILKRHGHPPSGMPTPPSSADLRDDILYVDSSTYALEQTMYVTDRSAMMNESRSAIAARHNRRAPSCETEGVVDETVVLRRCGDNPRAQNTQYEYQVNM